MSAPSAPTLRVVLGEDAARPLDDERRFDVLKALLDGGHSVTYTGGRGRVAPADASDVLVLAASEGAVDVDAEDPQRAARVHFRDISDLEADAVVALANDVREETASYVSGPWKPWFPVIDYDRCTDCMQCLSFCLFDVYGVDAEKHIEVRNNDKCKTNCPACSRVCPEVAILFPKYGSGPINGDEVRADDVDREKMKTNISALLGGDIYTMLRERHQHAESRFAKERDESKALKERMKCLKQLGEAFDVPPEVMMALPSIDEIRSKAVQTFERLHARPEEAGTGDEGPD